jgi:hypothetical protein
MTPHIRQPLPLSLPMCRPEPSLSGPGRRDVTRTVLTDGPLLPPRACLRHHTPADAAAALALLAGVALSVQLEWSVRVLAK